MKEYVRRFQYGAKPHPLHSWKKIGHAFESCFYQHFKCEGVWRELNAEFTDNLPTKSG